MSEAQGHVVTFYSFKGGTGRTMALANVAWILAANGKRVLVADWDLESPGLHRFFRPYLDQDRIRATGGIIDMIRMFEWHAGATERSDGSPLDRSPGWHTDFAKVSLYAQSIQWAFPAGGTLDFLGAGRQNSDYATTLGALDWETFYDRLHGSEFFAALRADMKRNYDYTLIDSRTGLSDVADICTLRLPDTLVDCFTLSEQGIEGATSVARTIAERYSAKRPIRILPVPMRVDPAEKEKADAGKALAKRRFADFPGGMTAEERAAYWVQVEVPYQAFYAYEETLATFGDIPGSSMLNAFEKLTGYITNGQVTSLPPMEEALRLREMEKFRRRMEVADHEVMLWSSPEDEVWAEWVESLLNAANVRVTDPHSPAPYGVRTLAIISSRTDVQSIPVRKPEDLMVAYISDLKPLAGVPLERSTFIDGIPDLAAIEKVLRLVGWASTYSLVVGARYPGYEPLHFNPPARNPRFTGRILELHSLRAQLRAGGGPVVLQGTSGYGKTQIALEYAHRYRNAYDIVWWIAAEQSELLDSHLGELAERLGLNVGTAVEDSRALLNALSRGEPSNRWLLIYDSADEIDRVLSLLPKGGLGHVIITSIDPAWATRARFIDVPVFRRDESVAHLRRRLTTVTETQAAHVAEVFGDLPYAISNAEAWLVETGTPIADYLRQIESGPAASIDAALNQWRLLLSTLRGSSPGAYRLIELCATLAGEISLELIYSDEMAGLLAEFDPMVRGRDMLGILVQNLNRLSLIKLDPRHGQMHIHLLLRRLIRDGMLPEELERARHQMHLVLAESRPRRGDVDDPETWSRFRLLWPHLIESGAIDCPDEKVRQLLLDRLRYLSLYGDLSQGEVLGRRVFDTWSAALANDDGNVALRIQLLQLRFNLANILRSQGKFEESRQIDMEVLEAQRVLLGPEHPDALMTSGSLAGDLRCLGRYEEALDMDQVTYHTWLDLMGEEHPRTLMAANNLATAHRLVGDYRSAREHDQRVYDKRRRVNPIHPFTFASGSNLGRDHRDEGEYDRSVSLLRNIYEGISAALGTDDIRAVVIHANYAVSLRAAGRAAEAMPILEVAYRQLERLRGETDPATLACRLSRAVNLLAVGREREADQEMQAVIEAYTTKYGPDHPHTLACECTRSAMLRALRKPEAARDLAQRAAERLSSVLSDDHPFTIGARMNQAVCLAELGELDEARFLTEEAVERLSRTAGADHPDTMRARANLALIRRAQDDTPVTVAAVAQAVRSLARVLSSAHPTVVALSEDRYAHRIVEPHPF